MTSEIKIQAVPVPIEGKANAIDLLRQISVLVFGRNRNFTAYSYFDEHVSALTKTDLYESTIACLANCHETSPVLTLFKWVLALDWQNDNADKLQPDLKALLDRAKPHVASIVHGCPFTQGHSLAHVSEQTTIFHKVRCEVWDAPDYEVTKVRIMVERAAYQSRGLDPFDMMTISTEELADLRQALISIDSYLKE